MAVTPPPYPAPWWSTTKVYPARFQLGAEIHACLTDRVTAHVLSCQYPIPPGRGKCLYTGRDYSHRKDWFMFKQAARRSSSLVDAGARCSRLWFQGKTAARIALV